MIRFAVLVFFLSSCGNKSHKRGEKKGNPPSGKEIQEVATPETEQWFSKQNSDYDAYVEGPAGQMERVRIIKDSRVATYTFYRDVSEIDSSISSPTFCRYEISGPVKKVERTESVVNFTTRAIDYLDMDAKYIEHVDSGPQSDRNQCALFEKNERSRMPYALKGLPFRFYFETPKEAFKLEKGELADPVFSFLYMKTNQQAPEIRDWDLEFDTNYYIDREDMFSVKPRTSLDDYSRIYDLGDRNCDDLGGRPNRRYLEPEKWLMNSSFFQNNLQAKTRLEVKLGHCYLVEEHDSNSHIVALFRVSNHDKGRSVTIHQIEILHLMSDVQ